MRFGRITKRSLQKETEETEFAVCFSSVASVISYLPTSGEVPTRFALRASPSPSPQPSPSGRGRVIRRFAAKSERSDRSHCGASPFVFRRHWDHEPPPHPPFGHPLPLGGGEGGVRGVRGEGEWRVEQLGEHRELFPLPEGEGQGEGERDRAHRTEMDHSPNSRTPRVLRPSRTFPK